jgi:hypothetical protein
MRIFLSGMLSGVMLAAAVTYVFAIPANNYYWQMEVWSRGGATLTFDKNGRWYWRWIAEPIPNTPRQKPVSVMPSKVSLRNRATVDHTGVLVERLRYVFDVFL